MRQILLAMIMVFGVVQADVWQANDYSELLGRVEGIDDQVLSMHFKLYQGYVANTNKLYQSLQQMEKEGKRRTPEYAGLKRMFGWEFDGMRLHEWYFGNLGGAGQKLESESPVAKAITKDFGSFENWKEDFVATGLIRGIGWVVLYRDPESGKLINDWVNEHDAGHLAGADPLLIMDVFEHAYITQYGLDRAGYINAFMNNIDWEVVNKRFTS